MEMKHYWYTWILTGSIIVAGAALLPPSGSSAGGRKEAGGEPAFAATPGEIAVSTPGEVYGTGGMPDEKTGTATSGEALEAAPGVAGAAASDATAENRGGEEADSGTEDFSDTLFIGDSRTEGLKEYGGLSEAEFFSNSGMSSFNVFQEEVTVRDGSKKTLEQVLTERSYRRIYLMLGINELGYPSSSAAARYAATVERIRQLQPGAYLILEANLHVTKEKSESSEIYNNSRINALNYEIFQLAVAQGCGYLDVNGLFDDGQGNLDPAYSADSTHVMGKYYALWGQWLRTQAV